MRVFARIFMSLCAIAASNSILALEFSHGGATEPCRDPVACHGWVEAKGVIAKDSADRLIRYLEGTNFPHYAIRFESPGGDLSGGIRLGLLLRDIGFETEASFCASACVFAFLGGSKRTLVGDSPRLGVHRFYRSEAWMRPSAKQFTGEDLDSTQRTMAGLMLFTEAMGVDLRLISIAAEAGPSEMRWLSIEEAEELKVVFRPNEWLAWAVEPHGTGLFAFSSTQDGSRRMEIACKAGERRFTVIDNITNHSWFEQCRNIVPFHKILGLAIPTSETLTLQHKASGQSAIAFRLPDGSMPLTDASVFSDMSHYPMACISHNDDYVGTVNGLVVAANLALRNCIDQ